MSENEIYKIIVKKHQMRGDYVLSQCKSGPTFTAADGALVMFDVWAMTRSWTNPCITIYEIKSSRGDFLRDTKWPKYLEYCNQFAFACEPGVILAEEVQIGVGLYYVKPGGGIRTVKKPLYRTVDIPAKMYKYIIMCRLEKNETETTPEEFSELRKEKIRAWVEGKIESKELGYLFSSKLVKKVKEFDDKMALKTRQMEYLEKQEEKLKEIVSILCREGVVRSMYLDHAIPDMKLYFQTKHPNRKTLVARAIDDLEKLVGYLKNEQEMSDE